MNSEGCELTVHGVGVSPLCPITVRVRPLPQALAGSSTTRHAEERRPAEPKVEISVGTESPNAEGEDQLWRHAIDEARGGTNFLAFISDTDFKEAALVILPQLLWPNAIANPETGPEPAGQVFVASIDRTAPQTEKYWCMNEFVTAIADFPALADGIPGVEAPVRRLRCAHVAAALILMGGDTTPSIHGLTEELGLRLALAWAWYTGPLVEARTHSASSTELFRLRPEAVTRLHKVWYVLRTTPNIQKVVKYNAARSRDAQRAWLDALTLQQLELTTTQG